MTRVWQPGETALLRNVDRGRVWTALATTVVFDRPEMVGLYWKAGYPRKSVPGGREGNRTVWLDGSADISHVDSLWGDLEILCLTEPTAGHAAWMARRQGEFLGWYINIQRPLARTALGFDTLDQTLDLIIQPDLVTYRWKDEDEFAEDVRYGIFSAAEAIAIRAEGERVLQKAQRGESPFKDGWEAWQPDPAWQTPALPADWDRL
ncbi:MAG TPA: DUF402 domain-containing protein [Dehalococcoidia bacterium]|nr:DUF402 domain-containing protein [Dehalococcoidia bacterium]